MQGSDKGTGGRVLTFRAGACIYGVPLEWVWAVLENVEENPGYDNPDHFLFRGSEIPALDLTEWLGGIRTSGSKSAFLVVGREEASAAALIDSPGRVAATEVVYEWPKLCRPVIEEIFTGVMEDKDQLVLLIDPEELIRMISQKRDSSSQGGKRQ